MSRCCTLGCRVLDAGDSCPGALPSARLLSGSLGREAPRLGRGRAEGGLALPRALRGPFRVLTLGLCQRGVPGRCARLPALTCSPQSCLPDWGLTVQSHTGERGALDEGLGVVAVRGGLGCDLTPLDLPWGLRVCSCRFRR